jgi:pimeloyl-ACP methyl ester carboxylesterase
MQEKEIKLNNHSFFYREIGEGLPVILLHGFGEDGNIWKYQFFAFPQHRLLVPDLPGSGKSKMWDAMSVDNLAQIIEQWINALGIEKAVLIGHSMGGYIALSFAEQFPEKLAGWGLFHSTTFADSDEKIENRRKGIQFIQQHGASAFLETTLPNLYGSPFKAQNPDAIQEHLALTNNFSPEALVSYYEAMIAREDRTLVWQHSQVPVLIIAGAFDQLIPLNDNLKQASLPQLSYIHVLRQSGHMGMVEEPEPTNAMITEFLNGIENQA